MASSVPSTAPITSGVPTVIRPSLIPSSRPSFTPSASPITALPTLLPSFRPTHPTMSPTVNQLCTAYSVSNTASATNPNSALCYIATTPGSSFTISSCPDPTTGATCSGSPTYATLYDQSSVKVAATTSSCGSCGFSLSYTVPSSGSGTIVIMQYTILEGCVNATACSGRFYVNGPAYVIAGASRPSSKPVTNVPTSTPSYYPLPYQKNSPWPHFRGGSNTNGGGSINNGAAKNTIYWSSNLGSPIYGTVAVAADGSTFVATKSGHIYAFDVTGFELWTYAANNGIYSSIAIGYDTTLYFTTIGGTLYSLSQTGQGIIQWTFQATVSPSVFNTVSSPAITSYGVVYFGADKLYAVSTIKGSLIWAFDPSVGVPVGTKSYIASSPAIDNTGNIYFGSLNYNVYCVSSLGTLVWKYTTGGPVISSPAINGQAVYIGSTDGYLYTIGGGQVAWKYKTNGPIVSSPGLSPGGAEIYIGSNDNSTYSISSIGALNWKFTTGGPVSSPITVDAAGIVYFGSNDQNVYSLVPSSGSIIWQFPTKGAVSSSVSIGLPGMMYVGSTDNNIYCIGKLFVTPSPATSSSSASSAINTSFVEPLVISFVVVFFIAIACLTYYVAFGCEYFKTRQFAMNDEETMEGMENNEFPPEVDEAIVRKFEEEANVPLSSLSAFDVCQLLPNIDMAEYVINFRMRKITGKMLYKIETIDQISTLGINIAPEKKQDFLTVIEFMRQRGVDRKLLSDLPFEIPTPSKRPSIEMISSGEYYGNVAQKVAMMDGGSTSPDASNRTSVGVTRTNSVGNRNSTGKASVIGMSPQPTPRPSEIEDDPMSAYPGGNTISYSPTSPNAQGVYTTASGVSYTKTGAKIKEEDAFCNVCNKKLPSRNARECPSCRSMIIR